MSLLANLNTAPDVQEDTDSLGGGGPWDSGLYPCTVNMAFLQKSKSGALGLTLHLADENGRELRHTTYVTSGDAKGNKTYYERDGEKRNLPGFTLFRSLCLMTLSKEPQQVDTEEKVVKLWSPEAKAEVPTTVPVLVDLLGKQIIAGVIKQVVNKNVKDANGNYVPGPETREENEIDKFFHAGTGMTVAEATGGKTEGEFINGWRDKFTGFVKDRTVKAAAGAAPATSGTFGQAAGAATPKPTTSLFG
jgi:hypothetical protein